MGYIHEMSTSTRLTGDGYEETITITGSDTPKGQTSASYSDIGSLVRCRAGGYRWKSTPSHCEGQEGQIKLSRYNQQTVMTCRKKSAGIIGGRAIDT